MVPVGLVSIVTIGYAGFMVMGLLALLFFGPRG